MFPDGKMIKPEVQRVREEIAELVYQEGSNYSYEVADQILSLKGILIEADDQSLPKNPYRVERNYRQARSRTGESPGEAEVAYWKAQQDMLQQNWRKVVKEG